MIALKSVLFHDVCVYAAFAFLLDLLSLGSGKLLLRWLDGKLVVHPELCLRYPVIIQLNGCSTSEWNLFSIHKDVVDDILDVQPNLAVLIRSIRTEKRQQSMNTCFYDVDLGFLRTQNLEESDA